jgi:hypothetical protein
MTESEAQSKSSELIASFPAIDRGDDVPTTAGIYRLYKRRWLGVFAMVGTTFFFAWSYTLTR